MPINPQETMKPLLYLASAEPLPTPERLGAIRAVVIDATDVGARQMLSAAADRPDRRCALFARIEPADDLNEADLGLLLSNRIDGVVLAGCRGPADIQKTDVMLKVAEAAAGLEHGKTALLAEYASVPASVLSPHPLGGASPRLSALIFDASALAHACGLQRVTETGDVPAVVRLGRATTILRAREAGIATYEMLPADALDEWVVQRLWTNSVENGFSAPALRSARQIELLAAAGALAPGR
ncbi:aldolase [Sinorhizobium alkalisoli]|uniref:Aldolase n=1 Tax=Sinorhizobium alkalisoli TaxID=1752398 RepID=A0A1E3VEB4_9HYPH|nr:aldolase [Sinorhizobium alkalisoli]MCA1492873.1 aldolase [Ensifer sp. NBAIM29]MCG5477963.1 aldolase [Sinorhizobium alkalisoli]ODR91922.1 aldolase [Sinorhizobium alkalisoli]